MPWIRRKGDVAFGKAIKGREKPKGRRLLLSPSKLKRKEGKILKKMPL